LPEPAPITPPPPSPAVLREDAIDNLLVQLRKAQVGEALGDRIQRILADPVSEDPDAQPRLRKLLATMMREQITPDGENGLYLPYSLRPTVLALERRFHWLSDYTAFRRDFWQDTLLLDAMLSCAGMKQPPPPPRTRRRGWGHTLDRGLTILGSQRFWLAYVGCVMLLSILTIWASGSQFESLTNTAVVIVFLFTLIAWLSLFVFAFVGKAYLSVRRQKELFEDRRALRRNGRAPDGPFLRRLIKSRSEKFWVLLAFTSAFAAIMAATVRMIQNAP
ncbi:MAG: hypothetical protein ACRC6I_05070, partial [Paracoccaceae bacterium]